MMEYILKLKTLADNLAAIWEPIAIIIIIIINQILQLLEGLGAHCNSIVASLTACEDDVSIHSIHSIILTPPTKIILGLTKVEDVLVVVIKEFG